MKALAQNPLLMSSLDLNPLYDWTNLNMDTMIPDPDHPSRFPDFVAQLAIIDFYAIIVHYIDDGLHKISISATPIMPPTAIKPIADNDLGNNKTFYQRLQVPHLTSILFTPI